MNIFKFAKLISRVKASQRHLIRCRWERGEKTCPFCRRTKPYILANGRYRCRRCKKDFSDFTCTWLNHARISAAQWLVIIKIFEMELSARQAARQANLNYKTVARGYTIIRQAIISKADKSFAKLSGEVEADESYFGGRRKGNRGRGAAGKVPVFGLLERKGRITVSVVPDVTREALMSLTVKKVRFGSIIYTDKYRTYDALMTFGYKHRRIDHQTRFAKGPVYINGLEGFWSYAKERLIKFHGVSQQRFPLYLKEMEFRYNHRHNNKMFNILCSLLTKPVELSG
jgi:transposase